MVVLNKIYTRTGDDGTSALATGERRAKSDRRFEAIGAVDELNAEIGLARLAAGAETGALLALIQNDLFDLGADLAVPEAADGRERLRIVPAQVERLEREIDAINAKLAPLTSFVLPAGSPEAAALHLCRTVARRTERVLVALATAEAVNPDALRYVNRLSDLFFVAARQANGNGAEDVLWVPGKNR
jgi:cob(I)alamin adenosyltransferase